MLYLYERRSSPVTDIPQSHPHLGGDTGSPVGVLVRNYEQLDVHGHDEDHWKGEVGY